ncbi:MAG: hypothetical protein RMI30_04060 [Thermodesulfovibrio sp.]|nr:hypothetical protein [Thermodesulfovibrio sp.]
MAQHKINESMKIYRKINAINLPLNFKEETKIDNLKNSDPEIFAFKYVDSLKNRFPEVNLNISNLKKEKRQMSFEISLKAETFWNRFTEIISFLEETEYPFVFIKSIALSPKGNTVSIDIKAELKLFSKDDAKRV